MYKSFQKKTTKTTNFSKIKIDYTLHHRNYKKVKQFQAKIIKVYTIEKNFQFQINLNKS